METPKYKFTPDEIDSVYDPAEDTFLLLDALEKDAQFLTERKPLICLEIGSGSGVVSCFMARILKFSCAYFCTDINPFAACCTKKTAALNFSGSNGIMPLVCNLADPLSPLDGKVDVLLFNPPYVPTVSGEIHGDNLIAKSWAGGVDGREVLDRLLPKVPQLLSENGVFYLIALKENNIRDLVSFSPKLRGELFMSRRCGIEMLHVLKFVSSKIKEFC